MCMQRVNEDASNQQVSQTFSTQALGMMKARVLSGKHLRTQHYATQWYGKDIVKVVIQDDTALTKNRELVTRLKEKFSSLSRRFRRAGEIFDCRPIVGTVSTGHCCTLNATVGDALELMTRGKLMKGDPVIVTANVYFPVAKFLHMCTGDEDNFFMDLVYHQKYISYEYPPDFEVVTLRPDTELSQAQELVNERRQKMKGLKFFTSEQSRFGQYLRNSEIRWNFVRDDGTLMLSSHHRRIEEKRLWLQFRVFVKEEN